MSNLYVITRRDLPPSIRAVQAIHAALQVAHVDDERMAPWGDFGPTVILLGVRDETELRMRLHTLGSHAEPFYEPNLDDQLTAVAYYGEWTPGLSDLRLL